MSVANVKGEPRTLLGYRVCEIKYFEPNTLYFGRHSQHIYASSDALFSLVHTEPEAWSPELRDAVDQLHDVIADDLRQKREDFALFLKNWEAFRNGGRT